MCQNDPSQRRRPRGSGSGTQVITHQPASPSCEPTASRWRSPLLLTHTLTQRQHLSSSEDPTAVLLPKRAHRCISVSPRRPKAEPADKLIN